MIPESLTTWRTPAARAAAMKLACISNMSGADEEISIAFSTSRSAGPSDSVFPKSPVTTSTFAKAANFWAFSGWRTRARTATP